MGVTKGSRYESVDLIYVVDGATQKPITHVYPDLRQRVTGVDPEDSIVTPKEHEAQWPQLGIFYLLDARAWWAVADLSDVVDPFTELSTTTTLRVPTQHRYYFELTGQ